MQQKKDIKFSVIIPVYNCEQYLEECMQSVLNQTYHHYEIILVDDGSTDRSKDICDSFQNNPDIKVFHIKNQGPYIARQTALMHAKGDYVLFLDADDYWDKEILENMTHAIWETNCDIVIFKLRRVFKNRIKEQSFSDAIKNKLLDGSSPLTQILRTDQMNSLAIKCIRKSIFPSQSMYADKRLTYAEDMLQTIQIILDVKSVYILDKCLYNYRMRMGSSMHRNDSAKRLQDVFFVEEEIVHILEEKNLLTKNNKENYDSMYLKSIMECLFSLSNESLSYQEKKNIMQETKEHTYFCELLQEYKRDSITV